MSLNDKKMIDVVLKHFGTERIVAALPQREMVALLDLVSVCELADTMNVNYNTLRSYMNDGAIPFPTVRLLRRAYYSREQAERIKQEWKKRK